MNAHRDSQGRIHIFLSRSNLEGLLDKLNGTPPDSSCSFMRDTGELGVIIVTAEEDAEHYNSRLRQDDIRGKRGATWSDGARTIADTLVPIDVPEAS